MTTISEDTILTGIICNECGITLPPHSCKRHLNINDIIHKCPHDDLEQQLLDDYFIKRRECFIKNKDWLLNAKKRKGKGSVKRRQFISFLIIGATYKFETSDKDYEYCNKFGRGYWSEDIIESFTEQEQEIIINEIAQEYGAFDY